MSRRATGAWCANGHPMEPGHHLCARCGQPRAAAPQATEPPTPGVAADPAPEPEFPVESGQPAVPETHHAAAEPDPSAGPVPRRAGARQLMIASVVLVLVAAGATWFLTRNDGDTVEVVDSAMTQACEAVDRYDWDGALNEVRSIPPLHPEAASQVSPAAAAMVQDLDAMSAFLSGQDPGVGDPLAGFSSVWERVVSRCGRWAEMESDNSGSSQPPPGTTPWN